MTSISHDLCGNHMILTWLSGQTSIFGVVFFASKSPLGIERPKKLKLSVGARLEYLYIERGVECVRCHAIKNKIKNYATD